MSDIIMSYLVGFYIFLDIYIFVYSQELRVKSHYEYFEKLVQINCPEVEHGFETTSHLSESVSSKDLSTPLTQVSMSTLSDGAEELLAEIMVEVSSEEFEIEEGTYVFAEQEPFEMADEPEFKTEYDEQDFVYHLIPEDPAEDCILLSDLEEEQSSQPTGFEGFASAKIADGIDGPQQWVVSIVGMEDSYIHVFDGKRIWLNVEERATKLRMKDVLILDVIRNDNEVIVENIIQLETHPSDEYSIPDEELFFYNENIAV